MTNTRTWTVLELIDWSKGHLEEKGFDNARLEVELLLGHALWASGGSNCTSSSSVS